MAASLDIEMHSLKLVENKYQKKVAIVRPLVHEDSLVQSPVSLEKSSSSSSSEDILILYDDTDSSCCSESTSPASVHETPEHCLIDASPVLKIPDEMKSDPESRFYSLEYINEIHNYWKKMESKAVFPVDSGVLSKQSFMSDHHYGILVNWMIGVQQKFKLLNDTLYVSVNLINQYFKVCVNVHVTLYNGVS